VFFQTLAFVTFMSLSALAFVPLGIFEALPLVLLGPLLIGFRHPTTPVCLKSYHKTATDLGSPPSSPPKPDPFQDLFQTL
jgi:hypothetical protein